MSEVTDKYFITTPRPGMTARNEDGSLFANAVLEMKGDRLDLPGVPYFSIVWYYSPGQHEEIETHTHDFDEIVGFMGSNPDDPWNLNGKIRMYLDGEWVEITKSCVMFIPAGVEHCPYIIEEVERSILHWSAAAAEDYVANNKE